MLIYVSALCPCDVSTQSPGRKAATVNYGIQVGLSPRSLGNNGLRKILASANTPTPCRKSLQKTSNIVMTKVETKVETHNEAVMNRQLVDINRTIPVQCDDMYNNPLYSGNRDFVLLC